MKHWLDPFILFDDETNILRIKISEMLVFKYNEYMLTATVKCKDELCNILKTNYELIKDATIIVDSTWEPIDPTEFVNLILNLNLFSTDQIMVQEAKSVCQYKNTESGYHCLNQYAWFDLLQKENIDWKSIEVDTHFIALSRRPTIVRAEFMKLLLDTMREYGRFSFGTLNKNNSNIEACRKILYPNSIPIMIDDEVNSVSWVHQPKKSIMFKSLCNVIIETSQEFSFITEKTHKAFAWHQIPIWFAAPNEASKLRSLGFDLFDDMLDNHSYDSEPNTHLRMLKVAGILKRFVQNTPDPNEMRKQLWNRLEANSKRLAEFVEEDRKRFDPWEHLQELRRAGIKQF
jgi:hypothetical protein